MTEYDKALHLMAGENPDIFKVRLLLETAVSTGDERAEYALATWYLHGANIEMNLSKGIKLLKRAVDQGHVEATFDLAVCYERGKGVDKSESEAFRLYKMAADYGDIEAMREVGRMLYYGLGVAQDRMAADRWLAKGEDDRKDAEKLAV